MTSKKNWAMQGLAIALCVALSHTARAVPITFTVDTAGTISNVAGNIGNYNAGSWLTFAGAVSASGLSGNFSAAAAASGAWSSGNPGSLVSFFGGTLAANVDPSSTAISFPSGSVLSAGLYDAKYPNVAAAPVPLGPGIGGVATPTAPANYATTASLAFGLETVKGAIRGLTTDVSSPGNLALVGSPASQTFATNTSSLLITGGSFDYLLSGVTAANGNASLVASPPLGAVDAKTPGTLTRTTVDAVRQIYNYTIVIPVSATIKEIITGSTPATITLTTTGQIAAHANNVQVPEPSTFALIGCAVVPFAFAAWRRRKSA